MLIERYIPVFKAYDIRWLYDRQIDTLFAYIMWRGLWKRFLDQYGHNGKFLFWWDTRKANDELIRYFWMGMRDVWVEFLHCAYFQPENRHPDGITLEWWACSTSYLYWLIYEEYDLWVSFTASHNPAEYVGMKFIYKDGNLVAPELLKRLFIDEYYSQIAFHLPEEDESYICMPDSIVEKKDELHKMLHKKRDSLNRVFNFAVDYCHGAWVTCEYEYFTNYANRHHTIAHINAYADGTFPDHDSETQDANNYKKLAEDVVSKGRDFWVMFDGDVDRIWFVTNTGSVIPWDIITAIIGKQLLIEAKIEQEKERVEEQKMIDMYWADYIRTKPKVKRKRPLILYDVMSSRIIEDVIDDYDGMAERIRMWRFFMNKRVREKNAIFGWECSWHYLFGNEWGYELPLLALYYVCKEAESFKDFETMYRSYVRYFKSPVIDYVVIDKDAALAWIKHHFRNYDPVEIDWVNIFHKDFDITVRKSNTSDKIRFSVEAKTQEKYDELMEDMQWILTLFVHTEDDEDEWEEVSSSQYKEAASQ